MPSPQSPKPEGMASKYFSWAELLLLPSWGIYFEPSPTERANLTQLAKKMDEIRDFLGKPINVLCAIRPTYVFNAPTVSKNYNQVVQGAAHSAHIVGLAMDFTVSSMTCDEVRFHLQEELDRFGIRVERKPGSGWVHVDLYPPNPHRYFTP